MQNLGNRRSVQKCAQNAGSNVLKGGKPCAHFFHTLMKQKLYYTDFHQQHIQKKNIYTHEEGLFFLFFIQKPTLCMIIIQRKVSQNKINIRRMLNSQPFYLMQNVLKPNKRNEVFKRSMIFYYQSRNKSARVIFRFQIFLVRFLKIKHFNVEY